MQKTSFANHGMTLVELMVAMALGLLITLAAVSALIVSQQGFRSIDAAAQLRDNARFATDLVRRIVLQTGYLNTEYVVDRGHEFNLGSNTAEPNIKGFNNASYNQSLVIGNSNTVANSSRGINGSDMLIVRYQVGRTHSNGEADGTMINCAGMSEDIPPDHSTERLTSVFHIATSANNEPSLMCTRRNEDSGSWSTDPLIEGVESFQVLYGTYGVTPNTAPTAHGATSITPAAERYLRADQLVVAGDSQSTNANWARVRSVRIGMILRGPPGSAPAGGNPIELSVLGPGGFSSATDVGSVISINPADGRLRQAIHFTIHLRNPQETL